MKFQAFTADGFQVGSNAQVNRSGVAYHYVACAAGSPRVLASFGPFVGLLERAPLPGSCRRTGFPGRNMLNLHGWKHQGPILEPETFFRSRSSQPGRRPTATGRKLPLTYRRITTKELTAPRPMHNLEHHLGSASS